MIKIFSLIASVLALTLTSTGAVVGAAQRSGPGDSLYPVKTWSEKYLNSTQSQAEVQTEARLQTREQLQNEFGAEATETADAIRDQDRIQLQEQIHISETATPQHLNSQNPWTTDVPPVPGSSYGPGTGINCDGTQQNEADRGNGNKP
jgi:hypothetical protein